MGECLITMKGKALYKLPILNPSLPADINAKEGVAVSASFRIEIQTPGIPAQYTFQWYLDSSPLSGATGMTCSINRSFTPGTHSIYCAITNKAGVVFSRSASIYVDGFLPEYEFTGSGELINDGNYNWRLKLLTSGILTLKKSIGNIDVFLVGGGGPGGGNLNGGGSGYTITKKNIPTQTQTYQIVVGANGGASSAFGVVANGGSDNGSGGCGGGGYAAERSAGNGGTDGGNGGNGGDYAHSGGAGQGTTTREFGEPSGQLYGGGGGGAGVYGTIGGVHYDAPGGFGGEPGGGHGSRRNPVRAPVANTGGGAGGGTGQTGASGIVIIRNAR